MAAKFPLARSLLALACFALLVADSTARHQRRSDSRRNLPNCVEFLTGKGTNDVVILPRIHTPPYQKDTDINSVDNCLSNEKRLVGTLIVACDEFGPPAPSVISLSSLSQVVSCHTDGPCASGLSVIITQYCNSI